MISQVRLHVAAVPMATFFDHATRSRRRSESLLVELRVGETCGWGEGAPREYVTGENLTSATTAVRNWDPTGLAERIDWHCFERTVTSIAAIDLPELLGSRSAAAAVETALLDAVCRRADRSLADALRVLVPASTAVQGGAVSVSHVIHLSRDVARTLDDLTPAARSALRHVKIKVADPGDAVVRLAQARQRLSPNTGISLDVNGDWSIEQAEEVADQLVGVVWIEEPLPPRHWDLLARLRRRTGLPIMLDESCMGIGDLDVAADTAAATHVNVRLSKCGGLVASARLASRAHELGIRCQLGVHVAEVGPLWAAGRALATGWAPWEAVEAGRGDEWFPEPLTVPPFAVDRTTYEMNALQGPGIGVVPADELLRHLLLVAQWLPNTGWQEA